VQDRIRESWERIAADFDRLMTPLTLRLGEEVVERVGVGRGMQLLDVGAGSGAVSLAAARRGAHVLATDISPTMVERLLARARAEGLANLTTRAMDGYALDLEDETFDLTASQNGVSLFPDVARGLAEMVRVTRAGGRVVIVSFGPIQRAEFVTFFTGAMRAVVPRFTGLPTDPPPLPFQLAEPERLRRRMEEAGLSEVRVAEATWEMEFESGRHLLDTVASSNPIARGLAADLDEAQRDAVRSVLDGMLRERSGSAGGVLRNAVNIGIGQK
jgi:ubiquinone/menaquinone biosynthesis C-methylase UbiE